MKIINKSVIYGFGGALLGFLTFGLVSFNYFKDKETVEVTADKRLQYNWYAPELPKFIDFAGEKVPLERWEVRERLDRDILSNYYAHGGFMYILKLSYRYFPIIEERLKANGVPEDFKYLCVAESSLQQLTSSAGAQGMWQFMKETGTRYGLEINDEVDERYHVTKAIDAACIYFNEAYAKFGSWTAAAASYNCGQGGYNSHSTFQGSNNFYDIILPEETNRYIFRILAYKHLMSNARAYGYLLDKTDVYPPINTKKVTVTQSIDNLATFAQSNGSSYKILKQLNPWLRARKLTVKPGKSYVIEFPADKK